MIEAEDPTRRALLLASVNVCFTLPYLAFSLQEVPVHRKKMYACGRVMKYRDTHNYYAQLCTSRVYVRYQHFCSAAGKSTIIMASDERPNTPTILESTTRW